MPKILHASDLHLVRNGEERNYGLAVLNEIISIANSRYATHLLICGDMFNSFADYSDAMLLAEVKEAFSRLNEICHVVYISGNHELLGKSPNERLSAYNFGNVRLISDSMELMSIGGIEIAAVPFRKDYKYLLSEDFPRKTAFRVLMMHGIDSTIYAGPDTEMEDGIDGGAQIPDILISRSQASYAAFGHIHSSHEAMSGNVPAVYPGSSRVWRKGETGPRKIVIFDTDGDIAGPRQEIILSSAGQYRKFVMPVNIDGSFAQSKADEIVRIAEHSPLDWFEISFSGIIEDENVFEELKAAFHADLSKKLRKCTLDTSDINTFSALSGNPAARIFLEAMEARKPPEETPQFNVWLQARKIGLEEINKAVK